MKALIALLLTATAAMADDTVILNGTRVQLQPTVRPGAVAQIEFENRAVNAGNDNGEYALTMGDVSAAFTFTWNAEARGDDRISVTVPEGFVAVPRELTVPEGETQILHIYSTEGVGM